MSFGLKLIVCLVLATSVECLKCYECESQLGEHSKCEDLGEDHELAEECSAGQICAKYTIRNPVTEKDSIVRLCSSRDICNILSGKQSVYSELQGCRTCDSELCNSGEFLAIPTLLLLILFTISQFII